MAITKLSCKWTSPESRNVQNSSKTRIIWKTRTLIIMRGPKKNAEKHRETPNDPPPRNKQDGCRSSFLAPGNLGLNSWAIKWAFCPSRFTAYKLVNNPFMKVVPLKNHKVFPHSYAASLVEGTVWKLLLYGCNKSPRLEHNVKLWPDRSG